MGDIERIVDNSSPNSSTAHSLFRVVIWRKVRVDFLAERLLLKPYFSIDDEILWDVISNKLPDLASKIAALKSEIK